MTNQKPIVVQASDAELLPGQNPMRLLADSDVSGGVFSISSGIIAAGADNAKPHLHRTSWEVFCIIDGTLEILLDDDLVSVGGGGLVAVPPGVVHAFGATPDSPVEAFVFITPGVNRFDYFRLLPRILHGELPEHELAQLHETYDVHFVDSPRWHRRKAQRS